MSNILFIARDAIGQKYFGTIAQAIGTAHRTEILSCRIANDSALRHECKRRQLIVVGLTGSPEDIRVGVDALIYVTEKFPQTAVAVCMDRGGHDYCNDERRYCDQHRVRLGIFLGAPDVCFLAFKLVRPGTDSVLFKPTPWSQEDLVEIAARIGSATTPVVNV